MEKLTMSIIEAGKALGMSRKMAYQAAHKGLIPTIRFGKKRMMVPKAALMKLMENPPAIAT